MEKYIAIVNNKIDDLVKITINERKQLGMGVLFLDFTDETKLDCRYVAVNNEIFPENVKEKYFERMTSVPNSIIFFLIYNGIEELWYEVDLDKNSHFHENQNN